MDGFLNILKPPGMTSHDVVSFLRHRLPAGKIGHLGTLDPGAAGVLPAALGYATRLIEYMEREKKGYRVEVTFGKETDTCDGFGRVVATGNPEACDFAGLQEILSSFVGRITQRPPAASSVRVKGKHLYEYHRAGVTVIPPAREVSVESIRIIDFQMPILVMDVECGPGTYMRSLARDIGEALGCRAFLSFLVRYRSGSFHIRDALTLPEIMHLNGKGELPAVLLKPSSALSHLPCITLDAGAGRILSRGGQVDIGSSGMEEGSTVRAQSEDGYLIAICEVMDQRLKPMKVFAGN